MQYRSGSQPRHPVPDLIKQTHKEMKAFNDAQGVGLRINAPFDADWIAGAVLSSLDRRLADAQAFLDTGLFPGPSRPLGTEVFIVAVGSPGTARFRDGRQSKMIIGERRVSGPNSAEVRIPETLPAEGNRLDVLEREFGFSTSDEGASATLTDVMHGLENLLAHERVIPDYGGS
jgi:hypothetical protein